MPLGRFPDQRIGIVDVDEHDVKTGTAQRHYCLQKLRRFAWCDDDESCPPGQPLEFGTQLGPEWSLVDDVQSTKQFQDRDQMSSTFARQITSETGRVRHRRIDSVG